MLRSLTIQNLVLIKHITLEFDHGLTVLTGETGAGKSILLDAIGLIAGKRSDARFVRNGEAAAMLHAECCLKDRPDVRDWLEEQAMTLEEDHSLYIRRQIKADGSSKAYVNDQPVTLKTLKSLGEKLIMIYGQHGQKGLLDSAGHSVLLDQFAGAVEQRAQVARAFEALREAQKQEQSLQQALIKMREERDYLEHMIKELRALAPEKGEEEQLADQRIALMKAEKTGTMLQEISDALNGATPIASQLHRVQTTIMRSDMAEDAKGQELVEALERSMHELAEAESLIAEMVREDPYDEQELERTQDRLFTLKEVARKYRSDGDGLVDLLSAAEEKITLLDHNESALEEARANVQAAQQHYVALAEMLRSMRLDAIPKLCDALHHELAPLKMEATRFKVLCDVRPESRWNAAGMDDIAFEVSTNPGSPFAPLSEIASGGELSRFLLSMAVVIGAGDASSLLIFDEIDTGTGGAVAEAIGERLAALSGHYQVAVVTHLPQVAAKGHQHYFIEKRVDAEQTTTYLRKLALEERHEELARMLSGADVTSEARQAAAKLLESSECAA